MSHKILVVEDTPSVRELIANYLKKNGYEVIEAQNGKDALSKAVETLPHIVVTDVVMPEMNGFKLCNNLKKTPALKDLQIIVCTSKNQDIDRLWGIKQGANVYLTKPFTETELIEAVKSVTV